ncbi:MAG: hypothetical protein U0599_29095 [Vicinamibacteria bacterium]
MIVDDDLLRELAWHEAGHAVRRLMVVLTSGPLRSTPRGSAEPIRQPATFARRILIVTEGFVLQS